MASLTSSKASSCLRECSRGEAKATSGGEMTGSAIEGRIAPALAKAQLESSANRMCIELLPRLRELWHLLRHVCGDETCFDGLRVAFPWRIPVRHVVTS